MSTVTQTEGRELAPVSTESLAALLIAKDRPPRPSAWSASMTFGWRAILKIKHVPEQLFDVTAFPIMLVLMYTYLFGGALAWSQTAYIHFLLPGILVDALHLRLLVVSKIELLRHLVAVLAPLFAALFRVIGGGLGILCARRGRGGRRLREGRAGEQRAQHGRAQSLMESFH